MRAAAEAVQLEAAEVAEVARWSEAAPEAAEAVALPTVFRREAAPTARLRTLLFR